jgi:regulator of sigma E protease
VSLLFTLAVLALVLGVLIFIHELGHFVAAKSVGIHVHRFSMGLGSPIPWLTFTRGTTEYSVSWLPLGGYVKMATREEEATSSALEGGTPSVPVPPDQLFEAKPVWQRMIVLLAGVTMNALFAWGAFSFLAKKNGNLIDPVTTVGRVVADSLPASVQPLTRLKPGDRIVTIGRDSVHSWNDITERLVSAGGADVTITLADSSQIVLPIHEAALEERVRASLALQPYRLAIVGQLMPGRPGDRAGLQPGDTVLAVDGQPIAQWYDLWERIRQSAGREMALSIGRASGHLEVRVTPESDQETGPDGAARTVGRIGVYVRTESRSEPFTLLGAVAAGGSATLAASTQIVRTVRGLLSGRIDKKEVGGPIMIGQLAAQQAKQGLDAFLGFMALISVNLAVLNLLPIPVLDGGQLLFLIAEGVIGRPLSLKIRERLTLVGLILIGLLMVLAFSNDIGRLLGRH